MPCPFRRQALSHALPDPFGRPATPRPALPQTAVARSRTGQDLADAVAVLPTMPYAYQPDSANTAAVLEAVKVSRTRPPNALGGVSVVRPPGIGSGVCWQLVVDEELRTTLPPNCQHPALWRLHAPALLPHLS